jgi:lipoprotein-anchoring transpeptidase ErfK/SrfK
MKLIPDEELSLLSPEVPDESKSIVIDTAAQLVTAFEGETMVFSQRCSSGAKGTKTPLGDFRTYHKGPSIHMTNQGDAELNIYDLPGVPWVSFFTGDGAAIHGTYWHNDFGRPRSHGCVNLPSEAAKFIYRWTSPTVPVEMDYIHLPGQGTRVQVMSSNA